MKFGQTGWMVCFGMLALGAGLTPNAQADCGSALASARTRVQWQNVPSAMEALRTRSEPEEATTSAADASASTIVGLWKITFTSGGQVVDQGFDAWHSDGTETLNDSPAPSTGNVCLGVYAHTNGQTYKLYHPSWTFDDQGNLTGTAIIREQVTVDARRQTFQGGYTVDIYDLAGNRLGHFSGNVSATRITVN